MKSFEPTMTQKKPTPEPGWRARVILIAVGGSLIFLGREIIQQGDLWVAGYNARFGRFGYGPSLDYVMFGIAFVLVGIIPWKPVFLLLERFLPKLKKPRSHVKWL